MTTPILLSGFADEAANEKLALQQYTAFAALGLKYYSIRFVDAGDGVKNVMQLTDAEIQHLVKMQQDHGLKVSSIGSPIGKVKLLNVDDGTGNKFVPFDQYLKEDVAIACDRAEAFGAKLIRGFSFYHPKGTKPEDHVDQVCDQLSQIAEVCEQRGLTFGLEIEANLVGQTGQLLKTIAEKVAHPAMLTIFDGANIVCQGFTADETFAQYLDMKPSLGWVHIKDYHDPSPTGRIEHVDEVNLSNFVPADIGDCGHEAILRDLKESMPELDRRMTDRGADGVFCDLEPHVKGGGQFGGFSGPDGFGVVAARSLPRLGLCWHPLRSAIVRRHQKLMNDELNKQLANLEMGLAHLQRLFDQLNEVVTAQSLESQKMGQRISQLQEQLKQLKQKPSAATDPLDEKPPHY